MTGPTISNGGDSASTQRVCLGAFAGAHGVRGDARMKAFTAAAEDIAAYGAVETEDRTRTFKLKVRQVLADGMVIVSAPELRTREDALDLKGVRVYVDRAALPEADDEEFYYEDLVGLAAETTDGAPWGRVVAVYDFGAGDVLEIADIPGVKGVRMLPFTHEVAPTIDIKGGRIVVAPPEEGDNTPEPREESA